MYKMQKTYCIAVNTGYYCEDVGNITVPGNIKGNIWLQITESTWMHWDYGDLTTFLN